MAGKAVRPGAALHGGPDGYGAKGKARSAIAVVGHYAKRTLANLLVPCMARSEQLWMEGRGYQFVHIEGYARKPDARGRSVDYVLSEAERRPESCQHVTEPCPPESVFGLTLAELRSTHDSRAAGAMAIIAGGKTRRIRQDQLTLMTVVASHPATVGEVRSDPSIAAEVIAWEERVVGWLREQWGEELASVVRHVDEKHAHLHAYILSNDSDMRARRLHPGVAAKEEVKLDAAAKGADAKAANAIGDKAYRGAMRAMQDSFWRGVGIPCGLARIGPGRRRLTRAQWRAEKAGVAAAAEALQLADIARAEAKAARQAANTLTNTAEVKKSAAESLEARAQVAVANAQLAVKAARQQARHAKLAADQAQAAQRETERQTRMLAARGRRMIEQARADGRRIAEAARAEAERARHGALGIGAWLGALVLGLRGMAPALVASKAAATARAEERAFAAAQIAILHTESERMRRDLRQAETRLATASEAAADLGDQRDQLARQLNRLRGGIPGTPAPAPRTR